MKPGPYLIWGLLGAAAIVVASVFLSQTTSATSGVLLADGSRIQTSAILSGRNQEIEFDSFVGGELNAVMGGMELDFRESSIEGDLAILDLFVMMGGIQMRIPSDWVVVNEMTVIMGGIEDRTNVTDREGAKRLVLRGTLLMGGLDIRN